MFVVRHLKIGQTLYVKWNSFTEYAKLYKPPGNPVDYWVQATVRAVNCKKDTLRIEVLDFLTVFKENSWDLDGEWFQKLAATSCSSNTKFISRAHLLEWKKAESAHSGKVKRKSIGTEMHVPQGSH